MSLGWSLKDGDWTRVRQLFQRFASVFAPRVDTLESKVSTLDGLNPIDFNIPQMSGFTWTVDGGVPKWSAGTVTFNSTEYAVVAWTGGDSVAGSRGIYWHLSLGSGLKLYATASPLPTMSGQLVWYMASFDGTNITPAMQSNIIHGGLIQANSILVTQMGTDSVTDTELNSSKLDGIESNATQDQTGAQIRFSSGWSHSSDTTMINGGDIYTGSVTAAKITVTNLRALSADLGTITAGTITGVDGTFTNLTVTTDMVLGPADGAGTLRILIDGDSNTSLRMKEQSGSNYYSTVLDAFGMKTYYKSGSWPTEVTGELRVQIGGNRATKCNTFWAGLSVGLAGVPQIYVDSNSAFIGKLVNGYGHIWIDDSLPPNTDIVHVDASCLDFDAASVTNRYYDSGWLDDGGAGYPDDDGAQSVAHGLGAKPNFFAMYIRRHGSTDFTHEAIVEPEAAKGCAIYKIDATNIYFAVDNNPTLDWTGTQFNWKSGVSIDVRIFAWL